MPTMTSRVEKHSLHHSREVEDMRQSFRRHCVSKSHSIPSTASPSGSDALLSCQSQSTQPTDHSSSSVRPAAAPKVHYRTIEAPRYFQDRPQQESPRSSVASTVASAGDAQEDPDYQVPEYTAGPSRSSAIPATPADFSELFPSRRRLLVRHDDATLDGNMNLRVDMPVNIQGGRKADMTLFHLRMHDLRTRDFSLRRYCRDSGREVCHCTRKEQKASSSNRPSFQRSLSNAISSMRPRSSSEKSPKTSLDLKRNDSGYGSMRSVEMDGDQRSSSVANTPKPQSSTSNLVRLEFSNYAQVDVKQAGSKTSRRYEFEYWGARYGWKRIVHKEGSLKVVGFHLIKSGDDNVLGYIMPSNLTPVELEEEQKKGGWIPPCSMWIADEKIVSAQKDLSDVVVAAGLIALVDDSIKARFHSQHPRPIHMPRLPVGVELVGPRRFINEVLRRNSGRPRSISDQRPSTSETGTTGRRHAPRAVRQNSSHV